MNLDEIQAALCTVTAIPVTPFHADGSADFTTYTAIVERMVAGGITSVTPNGNTGEFYSLTPEEHERAVRAAVAGSTKNTLVMAGVGFDAATAAEMARQAVKLGAQAVMVHQPVHPFLSADGWFAYHRTVAEAVPHAGMIPYLRHPAIKWDVVNRLADACPNFVGIKYSVADPIQFASTVRAVGQDRLAWTCGLAESWAPFFWPGGASGFTSGLVNVTPAISLALLDALNAGHGDLGADPAL